jgi:hypothetical protein
MDDLGGHKRRLAEVLRSPVGVNGLKASKRAWIALLTVVALCGGALLAVASIISGQHAQGHWVQPAKLIGVCMIALAAFTVGVLLAGPTRRDR